MKKMHLRNVTLCRECTFWHEECLPEKAMIDQTARLCDRWSWDELCYTKPDGFCGWAIPHEKES